MSYIESVKVYTGENLDAFFIPHLSKLGVRVQFNYPHPLVICKAKPHGFSGEIKRKSVDMCENTIRSGYSVSDYYSLVFDKLRESKVDMDEFTGADLEKAEAGLFNTTINETLRANLWLGRKGAKGILGGCDGVLHQLLDNDNVVKYKADLSHCYAHGIISGMIDDMSIALRRIQVEGQLAIFVGSNIYKHLSWEFINTSEIPIVDINIDIYDTDKTFENLILLTDRRNIALCVNTDDNGEVRMWYNPDEMENRQSCRVSFGCAVLDEDLVMMRI